MMAKPGIARDIRSNHVQHFSCQLYARSVVQLRQNKCQLESREINEANANSKCYEPKLTERCPLPTGPLLKDMAKLLDSCLVESHHLRFRDFAYVRHWEPIVAEQLDFELQVVIISSFLPPTSASGICSVGIGNRKFQQNSFAILLV